jgi:hypothetical protein
VQRGAPASVSRTPSSAQATKMMDAAPPTAVLRAVDSTPRGARTSHTSNGVECASPSAPLRFIADKIRYVNQSSASALASLLVHGSVKRHVDVSRNVMLLSVGVDEMCQ